MNCADVAPAFHALELRSPIDVSKEGVRQPGRPGNVEHLKEASGEHGARDTGGYVCLVGEAA